LSGRFASVAGIRLAGNPVAVGIESVSVSGLTGEDGSVTGGAGLRAIGIIDTMFDVLALLRSFGRVRWSADGSRRSGGNIG